LAAAISERRLGAHLFLLTFLMLAMNGLAAERATIASISYIGVHDIAREFGLKEKTLQRGKIVQLSNPRISATFEADSRKVEMGGATILLSFPTTVRNGMLMISELDVRTTIEPIVSPHPSRKRIKTICLDPGHGGRDTGKMDGRNLEKNYTQLLANEVAADLRNAGFKVVLTRSRDKTLELFDRPEIARKAGADLFVSLHYNAGPSDVHGLEVYCLTPSGANSSNAGGGKSRQSNSAGNANDNSNVLLAYELQKTILRETGLDDRGMKRARFEVLREATMPAVLIEGGFMSNRAEARKIYDSAFRKRMARAVVDGILNYKQIAGR
jgi:N-acetylmuramoyl-L-alanine amidase